MTKLRLEPTGELPAGVHLAVGNPVAGLAAKSAATINLNLWADNTAAFSLAVKSDDPGGAPWATVTVNAGFSEATPVLTFAPNHVETGVAASGTVTETVTLKNTGLAEMDGVSLSLLNENGTAALSWAQLNAAANRGTMSVGEAVFADLPAGRYKRPHHCQQASGDHGPALGQARGHRHRRDFPRLQPCDGESEASLHPRANMAHHASGYAFSYDTTSQCHKREFLLKFAKDRQRWFHWLFLAKKPYGLVIFNYTVTSNGTPRHG